MNVFFRNWALGRVLAAVLAAYHVQAQKNTFLWGLATFKGTSLPECARLQISIESTPSTQPPFYLFALEPNALPTVQALGSDLNNLFWNVDHAEGSQLVLSMADAAGNPGGVATDLYTVTEGTTTACHAQNPTSPISITTNTSKSLNTCDILPMKISGGQKPYHLTVAALNSATVTNVSMDRFDEYLWVNRASPNTKLIAVVSDATGQYGAGTALLSTAGTTDLTCNNRPSTFVDSAGKISPSAGGSHGPEATDTPSRSNPTKNKTSLAAIIGASAAGAVLLGALVAGLFFFCRKRRSVNQGPRPLDGGYGLGKVGGGGEYPVAEERTPMFSPGPGPSTPYRDYEPNQYGQPQYGQVMPPGNYYNQGTYSSGAETLVENQPYVGQHGQQILTAPQVPLGVSSASPLSPGTRTSMSPSMMSGPVPTFNPYANVPTGSTSGPSTQSMSTVQPSAYGAGTGSDRFTGAGAGPSSGALTVANPAEDRSRLADFKSGEPLPEPTPRPIVQHEDVEDVVELPPAYKERQA